MKKLFLFLVLITHYSLLIPHYSLPITHFPLLTAPHVHAATEFSTDFRSTYEVDGRGVTHVNHQIKITNNLSHIYTTEYTLQIGSPKLDKVVALVKGENLPVKLEANDSSTTIKISIIHPQIGLGAVTDLILSYDTTDIAEKIGDNWEINIPRLARANEATFYSRKLIIPASFGEPSTITPSPTNLSELDGNRTYEFVGYTRDSISLLFGKSVSYELNLSYLLNNPTLNSADTELALPPDTAYQKVIIDRLEPNPQEIKLDKDGNWLAVYNLKPQEDMQVQAKLFVTVSPNPIYTLTQKLNEDTLKPDNKYWQKSPAITSLATKLTSTREIYDYLVNNYVYDFRRIGKNERIGAELAIDNPSSVICTEFTDSFIALARNNKIPAVEINGYAYTNDSALKPAGVGDILHAWPAYYDREKNTWYQIDPTWGSTTGGADYFSKLDFSHIAFVIHGSESEYPIPAGAYKDNPNDISIKVSLATDTPLANPAYKVEKNNKNLEIRAVGNAALHDQNIAYEGRNYQVDYLPPMGKIAFPLEEKLSLFSRLLTWVKSILN